MCLPLLVARLCFFLLATGSSLGVGRDSTSRCRCSRCCGQSNVDRIVRSLEDGVDATEYSVHEAIVLVNQDVGNGVWRRGGGGGDVCGGCCRIGGSGSDQCAYWGQVWLKIQGSKSG